MPKQTEALLRDALQQREPELLHRIAVSIASFIAEIDANSNDVAAYIEQRLAPLVGVARVDARAKAALEMIERDGRKLKR